MAAGMLPSPGTEFGPCAGLCAHTDCAMTRRMAASSCRYCGQPIGYDMRFYQDPAQSSPYVLVHARCEEEAPPPINLEHVDFDLEPDSPLIGVCMRCMATFTGPGCPRCDGPESGSR